MSDIPCNCNDFYFYSLCARSMQCDDYNENLVAFPVCPAMLWLELYRQTTVFQ